MTVNKRHTGVSYVKGSLAIYTMDENKAFGRPRALLVQSCALRAVW